jgi:large subunit ribosomal protein L23
MSDLYEVIKRPVVTEKTSHLREEENQYVFEVATGASKVQIRQAVEKIFGVRVADVRTSIVRGKVRRMRRGYGKQPNWKKAVISLQGDDVIELFEGV